MNDLIKNIKAVRPYNVGLMLRHADRDIIPHGSFGNEVLLNHKGIERSISFGEELKTIPVTRIYTSPVPRCVETSEYIVKGYGSKIDIIETNALGDPGLHIENAEIAGEYFLKYGFHDILDNYIKGKIIPGMPAHDVFKKRINDFIETNLSVEGLTLFITHDSLVAMYEFINNGIHYTKENWVKYLKGPIIK